MARNPSRPLGSDGRYPHKTFAVPEAVRAAARDGLALRKQYGRGGTDVGIDRAKQLVSGRPALTLRDAVHMNSYFARHAVDNLSQKSPPSNGWIAWQLWGGDAGRKFVKGIVKGIVERRNPTGLVRVSREEVIEHVRKTNPHSGARDAAWGTVALFNNHLTEWYRGTVRLDELPDIYPASKRDVKRYAKAAKEGSPFPAVVVYVSGGNIRVADGAHRIVAARALGHETIEAYVGGDVERDVRRNPSGKPEYKFVTDCRSAQGDDIREMACAAKQITLETFRRAIGAAGWKWIQQELGYDRYLPISKDWHVGYYRSTYRGVPCYYLRWSGIEFVFTLDGKS